MQVLDSTYGLRLPNLYTDWLGALGWFVCIDWQTIGVPAGCFSSLQLKYIVDALVPLVVIALVVLVSVGWRCAGVLRRQSQPRHEVRLASLREAAIEGCQSALPFSLIILFFFVASVSARIFRARACVGFGYADQGRSLDGESLPKEKFFLREDLSIECYNSAEHASLMSLMWVFVFVWPIGVLVLFFCVVYPCRHSILAGQDTPLTRATAFLHRDYQPHVYFWEALELARRTLLTGWVLLLDESDRFFRLLIATAVSICYLTLLVSVKPYKRPCAALIHPRASAR